MTTAEHKFYVLGKGFVPAVELSSQDQIASDSSTAAVVLSIKISHGKTPVFNFEVHGDHTYFVSGGKSALWVHNMATECGGPEPNPEDIKAWPSRRGNAPIGDDGFPYEGHHPGQLNGEEPEIMTRTEHRLNGNFKRNHANTGQSASNIDRPSFAAHMRRHWRSWFDYWKGKQR